MKIDKKIIKELVDYLNEFNLTELEYKDGDKKVKVSKNFSNIVQSNITKNQTQKNKPVIGTKINSPIIGTAYLAPEPGGKKFVEIGKKIKKGDTVMIIEAMKTMNHIPSPKDGTVKSIYVEDGQPVEFGQLLVLLD
tara:strand:+ start:129 stop:536 length:408 start_codon:yes stop_codon:yes gene_type:complete